MTCQMLHSLSCPHRVYIENEMIQRWPKDGPKVAQWWPEDGPRWPKEGRNNPKNLEYILTIHILSTAKEITMYQKNPVFNWNNYLALRRDKTKNKPPSSFPSAYFEKVNKSSQTKSNQTNQPSIRTFQINLRNE